MSEKTMPYSYGTEVWVKVVNRYWWPGIVVDPLTIPDELLEYVNKVNPIAVVQFIQEDKYEVVVKDDKITPYSCPLKIDHIKRGISLHKNQKKGLPVLGKFDMENFKKDVVSIERRIGGDIFIFETIEKSEEHLKSIMQCFTPSNVMKPKKKEVSRMSLPAPTPKELFVSTPKSKRTSLSKQKTSPPSRVVKLHTPIRTPIASGYACHVKPNCTYTTNRYDLLKRHMASHKNDTEEKVVKKSPVSTTNKRKNVKTKLSSDAKKIKLQNELLKDWENDGDDEDVEFDTSNASTRSEVNPSTSSSEIVSSASEAVPSTSEAVPSTSEAVPSTNEVVPSTSEAVPSTSEAVPSASEAVPNASEAVPSTSEAVPSTSNVAPTIVDVIPTTKVLSSKSDDLSISNEIEGILDFNKNDNITPVVEQRQSKSDSTEDNINDTFELQLTSDVLNHTVSKISSKESHLVEGNKNDSSDESHKLQSNEFTDKNDDQTKNTELLLEKTVNTLDQITHFENSLSGISSTLNKSNSNILTKADNIIDVPKLSEFEPSNPNKDVYSETDNITNIVENMSIQTENHELVENMSIQTENHELVENTSIKIENHELVENMSIQIENHELVEESPIDLEIVPKLEVNQSNDTTMDKDMPIENTCSVNSISSRIDSEATVGNETECLIDGLEPDWTKEDNWRSFTENGLKEANSYSAELKLPSSHEYTLPEFLK
ncbi:chitinase-like protein PB1E7.04c isoform X2 [Melanaphis sacchari]|uniref:chitinase-like protein PB1E7.04c isoform X2 n=1 Tax=Melanaphis sacchari TaxID=742174 RepID=UPI000DC15820|nr:chitinase-like protein PB1E7.04c isoform X2 [Melanaphis sacchari]